ncbi:efflux transporter outer membrane subunit [Paraburkholderia sprentiae WSM5005]|uniref:Efflux transporter outer membrane subunit n=1 Tax=Paraburkholderia sprentiae WSM5005 TaxID=754502 RepID=A0A1I9YIN6_9BURK|nr:efflux transporter outer membrane subunit [Paraburkholderia sprentiae]APA86169.1 efflux transporter outer membrane subunit [Paraburkholderia sprentiae WSM5005]
MQSDRITRARAFAPRVLTLAVCAACATFVAACAVGPNYQRPATEIPASFKEAAPGWKVAEPADQHDRGDWWAIYEDPKLNELEDKLNAANQTIAQFAANYRQARALVGEARAAYFPTIGASAGAARSGNGTQTGSITTTTSREGISNSFNVQMQASWEPDLWGSVTRSVNAQKAGQQGAAADLANARLSAQATLAQTYFLLRALDSTQKLLDDTVIAYQRSLQLTQNQYAAGVAARSDVIQAQTQLQSAQAAAIDNGIQRAQDEHAIAVLVGVPASMFSLPPMPLTATPPAVPAQMPSALLERRPDIASAERKAAAANEQIGVAIAAFFPSLTLSASGGFENSVFSQLLTLPSRFWTLGPQLAGTIFDAGLRKAQTDAARATYDADVATYRQTVLTAFQDVEDNLAALRILEQEIVVQRQAVASARQALAIVTNEYKAGTVGFVNVLTAQTTAFTAELKLESISGQRMVSSVGLVKALGGGWDVTQMNRETGEVAAPAPLPASAAAAASLGATSIAQSTARRADAPQAQVQSK